MLKIFTKYQIFPISTFNKQPIFFFAGSHGQKGENHGHEQHDHNDHDHHEIDLGKMKLREEKSGKYDFIKVIILTLMRQLEECSELLPNLTRLIILRMLHSKLNGIKWD